VSLIDDTIKMAGSKMSVIRTPSNLSSWFREGTMSKKGLEPSKSYERFFLIPTDSGVVEGDLIQNGSEFFLVMSLAKQESFGEFLAYQGTLYKCNSIVTVRKFNSSTDAFADAATGVNCVIARALAGPGLTPAKDDVNTAVSWMKGLGKIFNLFIQNSATVDKNSLIIDASGRQFRISSDSDPFVTNGVLSAEVVWANA